MKDVKLPFFANIITIIVELVILAISTTFFFITKDISLLIIAIASFGSLTSSFILRKYQLKKIRNNITQHNNTNYIEKPDNKINNSKNINTGNIQGNNIRIGDNFNV